MRTRSSTPRSFTDVTSAEATSAATEATLVWAIGGIEQHGPHLPLSVDFDIADALARQVAAELDGYTLPSQPISVRSLPQSGGGLAFPGTVFVHGTSFVHYITNALTSLAELGPRRVVVLNGHYENEVFLFEALDMCRSSGKLDTTAVVALSWWSAVQGSWTAEHLPDFPGWHAEHAGLTETSLMMFLRPQAVREDRPEHDAPPPAGVYAHPVDVDRISHNGALSSTAGASAEIGEALFWHVVDNICELVRSPHREPRQR